MGTKLSKGINIEAHSASESVIKEFKRVGVEIKIVKFPKITFKLTKEKSTIANSEKIIKLMNWQRKKISQK